MDPLSDVISALEPRNYRVGGFEAGGGWSVRFDAFEGIKCYAVASGACWIAVEGAGEPRLLKQDDCFLLPHGWPFSIASDFALPHDDRKQHFFNSRDGALVRLNDSDGVMVIGSHFELAGPHAEMLIGILPPIVHVPGDTDRETLRWAFNQMRRELTKLKPGSSLIAQQLAQMIFVQVLRLYLDESGDVGWLAGLSDTHVGAALTAIHREPGRCWTVAALASEVGMSRSGFAARFAQLVGDGPIEYLTRWRMLLAARRLTRGDPVGAIAHALGYESESAFRTAFKRTMGSTPRHHRRPEVATTRRDYGSAKDSRTTKSAMA